MAAGGGARAAGRATRHVQHGRSSPGGLVGADREDDAESQEGYAAWEAAGIEDTFSRGIWDKGGGRVELSGVLFGMNVLHVEERACFFFFSFGGQRT